MVKASKALVLTAGLAGAAGIAAMNAQTNHVSAATQTGTVTYSEGATTVWSNPTFRAGVQRYVLYNDQIAIQDQKTINGTIWYKIGANEWIPELYLSVAGQNAQATTSAAQAQTQSGSNSTNGAYKLTVTYTGGSTTVWTSTSYHTPTGQYLTPGQQVDAVSKQTVNGETWYKLANGGFVPARFAGEGNVTVKPSAPAQNQTTPTQKAPAQQQTAPEAKAPVQQAPKPSTPAPSTPAPSTPAPNTNSNTSAAPAVTAGNFNLTVNNPGGAVTVWTTPAYATANGTYLSHGTSVKANGKVTAKGEVWYRLSNGGFVPARYLSTGAVTPSAPTTQAPAQKPAAPSQNSSNQGATQAPSKPVQTPSKPTQTTPAKPSTPVVNNGNRAQKIAAVVSLAKQQLGKPYVWGGKGPSSFDCSGLMYYVFLNATGKNIGGWTGAQEVQAGSRISLSQLQVGDLIFWANASGSYHVALYLGNNQYLHAPQPGETVKISTISSYFMPSYGVRVNL